MKGRPARDARGIEGRALAVVALLGLSSCTGQHDAPQVQLERADELPGEPLQPLPAAPILPEDRVALGQKLFGDASLSADRKISCTTCHPLDRAGADGLSHSRGALGRSTALNTPTIFNAGNNFRYNWNGAYRSLEDEFEAPVEKTMGMTWSELVQRIDGTPGLSSDFRASYPDGVTIANIKDALASYIRTLATPGSRFDGFLRGDVDALSPEERDGYGLFRELGCVSCHQGSNVGGNVFQRFGVMRDYFTARGGPPPTGAELGRFNVTHDASDRLVFRVPSLRNVGRTAPYFHDGSAPTLEEAVDTMASVQLGIDLTTSETSRVVAFLRTLTGEFEGHPL